MTLPNDRASAGSSGTRGEAMKLASRGFRVFPARANDKRPLQDGWQAAATSDAFSLLESFPDGANIGIATGDDFTVIDADVKSGGLESVEALGLPPTLTVRTRSGGLHYYFRTPRGQTVANSASRLAPGVDVRGAGGYVVGPGSVVGGRPYVIENDAPVAELPTEIVARCHAARERSPDAGQLALGVDPEGSEAGAERARQYVLGAAPKALEGQRDNTAAKVAARIYDFTPSRDTCLELLELWNETKCTPPLEDDDLARIAWSMRKSRGSVLGRNDPVRHFGEVDDAAEAGSFRSRVWTCDATEEAEREIPPRPWLVRDKLIREAVTVLAAPGSSGKSLWSLQVAVALAIGNTTYDGRTLAEAMIGVPIAEETRVLVINNEDPGDELRRRLAAITTRWAVDRRSLGTKVNLFSGAQKKFKLSKTDPRGVVVDGPWLQELKDFIREDEIGCVVFDPFVSMHSSSENDNTAMQAVMEILTGLAAELRISVLLVHHTNKPPMASSESYAGNVNAVRGASAIKDAARIALTMFGMTKADGEGSGVPAERRHRYVRMDDAKANLHLATNKAQWFQKESITIGNGESMGILVPVSFGPDAAEQDLFRLVFAAIEKAEADGKPMPSAERGDKVAASLLSGMQGLTEYGRDKIVLALRYLRAQGAIEEGRRGSGARPDTLVWRVVADEKL